MLLVVADGRTAAELEMHVNHPAATVADLADALGVDHDVLHLDGRRLDPDLGLDECGLFEGAVVRLGPGRHDAGRAGWWLEAVGGLDAGRRQPLTPGAHVVGRDPAASVVLASETVSARHAEITVPPDGPPTVRDLESRNGTWCRGEPVLGPVEVAVDDTLSLGAVDLVLRPERTDDRPRAIDATRHATAAGLVPFNRPPRAALAGPAEPLPPPEPPAKQGQRAPIMVVTALAPLVMAAVMVQVYGRIVFALFALMSPIMIIGGALERRRRQTTGARKDRRRYRRELDELEEALDARAADERTRLSERVPDLAEVARRAQLPSTRLWERRPGHEDVLELRLGIGDAPWEVPVQVSAGQSPPEELAEVLERHRRLTDAPFVVDLDEGGVIGLAGDRDAALAVARSLLCQAAVHHGPADLGVVVLAGEETSAAWDWAKWLPHTRDAGTGQRWLAAGRDAAEALVEPLLRAGRERDDPPAAGPTVLAVVDDESLLQGRRAPTRTLLRGGGGPVAGIVIADSVDRLPAMCTGVVDVRDVDGTAVVHRPADGTTVEGVRCSGASDATARGIARSLAAFEDPELAIVGAGLPDRARLLPLLGLEDVEAATLLERWRDAGLDPPASGVIGVDEDDVFDVDLDRDGPHGLVAGTTGAGKSELLRTLVASMAIASSPQALTFVLVDFKGGSAFDACARLPHTVGLVTDLDEHLAERALRCLEAELHHRERLLRDVGASDLAEYRAQGSPEGPLPRLLVVVDEFATLKAELPDFVESLVGVAQRGRSLGVHMILATQRPSGAVSENIRANTNLRIALRVQDSGDSNDVIGVGDAAQIPRGRPGRAYVRLGPGEVVAIQTALSTAGDATGTVAPVEVSPFRFAVRGGPAPRATGAATRTDLELLVDAAAGAFARSGWAPPRRPWPEPLPSRIDLTSLTGTAPAPPSGEGPAPFALADDPDAQAQYPVGWDPREGNLLLIGIPGSGVTTTVATLAISLASRLGPDGLHLYVLDMGAGELAPLAELPHAGAVVGSGERERQVRVIRHLRAELDRRRRLGPSERRELPRVVLVVDGFAAFASEFREGIGGGVLDDLERLVPDGPEVAITTVLTGDRVGAVPARVAAVVPRKVLFRLADAGDYGLAGVRLRHVPDMPPGRAFDGASGQLVQAAIVDDLPAAVATVAARAGRVSVPPAPIHQLPSHVALADLPAAEVTSRPWRIPVGLAEHDLEPVRLEVFEGEHVYLGGTARSGRSTLLATVATAVRSAAPAATLVGVTTPRSPLEELVELDLVVPPDRLGEALDAAEAASATERVPVLVLVDDAELVDDTPDGRLAHLTTRSTGPVLVVAAGRNDALRANFGHWSRGMRRAKLGALLRPDLDLDGDLLGLQLPRRLPVPLEVPGRGFVVNGGRAELAQLAILR